MSEAPIPSGLDDVLAAARNASPSTRIELRDAIAAHGEDAIEAMTDWLGEPRLARFAIRVLERIGLQPATKRAVLDVLVAVDRDELEPDVVADVDRVFAGLGGRAVSTRSHGSGTRPPSRPPANPGVDGRGYWVMRTSQWERPYIWAEAQRGRLRQGWGWNAEMNLEAIAEVLRRGGDLSEEQHVAWRSRRMLTSQPDGMHRGDLVIAPNIPVWGVLSVFRIVGSYEYSLDAPRRWDERFGHVLPVELLAESIDRRSPRVSDGLRAMLRPQTRLYNITAYGGDVERLLDGKPPRPKAASR
jgi:hypothetical protein